MEGSTSLDEPHGTTKWLAELQVAGTDCAHQVWSNLGREHLEGLLAALARIDAG